MLSRSEVELSPSLARLVEGRVDLFRSMGKLYLTQSEHQLI
jgi:hypothetical protein